MIFGEECLGHFFSPAKFVSEMLPNLRNPSETLVNNREINELVGSIYSKCSGSASKIKAGIFESFSGSLCLFR